MPPPRVANGDLGAALPPPFYTREAKVRVAHKQRDNRVGVDVPGDPRSAIFCFFSFDTTGAKEIVKSFHKIISMN